MCNIILVYFEFFMSALECNFQVQPSMVSMWFSGAFTVSCILCWSAVKVPPVYLIKGKWSSGSASDRVVLPLAYKTWSNAVMQLNPQGVIDQGCEQIFHQLKLPLLKCSGVDSYTDFAHRNMYIKFAPWMFHVIYQWTSLLISPNIYTASKSVYPVH